MLYILLAVIAIGVLLMSRGGKFVLSWLVIGGIILVAIGVTIGVLYYFSEGIKSHQEKGYARRIEIIMDKTSLTPTNNLIGGDYSLQIRLRNTGTKQVKRISLTINYYTPAHQPISSEEVTQSYFAGDGILGGQILIPGGEATISSNVSLHPPNQEYLYNFTIDKVEF